MKSRGFNLIEVLIVLVIVAILTVMAQASYRYFVLKARRAEAQTALLELMQQQERHFLRHHTYVAFSVDATEPEARRFKWHLGSDARRSAYELRGRACPNQRIEHCVELLAIPGTPRVDENFKDPDCSTLSLDSTGQYRSTGIQTRCWP